jgi:hypothetical protein
MSNADIKEVVKEKYGQAALRVKAGGSASCCGTDSATNSGCGCGDPITANLYDSSQAGLTRVVENMKADQARVEVLVRRVFGLHLPRYHTSLRIVRLR